MCGYFDDADFDSNSMCCECGGGTSPTPSPSVTSVPTVKPAPTAGVTTYYASSFSELSAYCEYDNADITVTGDITFTDQITVSGVTVSITSTTGATLTSDRSFSADSGGMLYIDGATVTLSGLHFVSGSASIYGGCLYADASDLIVNNSSMTKCYAVS